MFRLNSLAEDLPVLREVSSLITCHGLRGSPSDLRNLFLLNNSLACRIATLTLLRILLKHAKWCGSLELIAYIFIISLLCTSFFKSAVIQSDFWERTRLVSIGAFLSAIARKFDFHSDQSSFGSFEELRKPQLWLEISLRMTECLKSLKLP